MKRSRESLRAETFADTVMRERRVRERLGTIMDTSHARTNEDHTSGQIPSKNGDMKGGRTPYVAPDPIKLRPLMPHPQAVLDPVPVGGYPRLPVAFGLRFEDLFAREGLLRVDESFVSELRTRDAALA